MKDLIEAADIEEAIELLDHPHWATRRWYVKDDQRSTPQSYGPFSSPAEALECADEITAQQKTARQDSPIAEAFISKYGEPVVHIVPLYMDWRTSTA